MILVLCWWLLWLVCVCVQGKYYQVRWATSTNGDAKNLELKLNYKICITFVKQEAKHFWHGYKSLQFFWDDILPRHVWTQRRTVQADWHVDILNAFSFWRWVGLNNVIAAGHSLATTNISLSGKNSPFILSSYLLLPTYFYLLNWIVERERKKASGENIIVNVIAYPFPTCRRNVSPFSLTMLADNCGGCFFMPSFHSSSHTKRFKSLMFYKQGRILFWDKKVVITWSIILNTSTLAVLSFIVDWQHPPIVWVVKTFFI